MVAALFTHELDAVKRHEWRILPLTSFLPEKIGEQVFIWAHAPLFFVVLWYSLDGPQACFAMGLSIFAMIHLALHLLLRDHPANEFKSFSSWAIITLTGLLGSAHLLSVTLI